jgi:hypothetical protein
MNNEQYDDGQTPTSRTIGTAISHLSLCSFRIRIVSLQVNIYTTSTVEAVHKRTHPSEAIIAQIMDCSGEGRHSRPQWRILSAR